MLCFNECRYRTAFSLSDFVGLFGDEIENKGYKAQVIEILKKPGKPLEAIQAAINAGVKCDGLVLSGHFCGSFHGSRLKGAYVTLPMIEKLSCNPTTLLGLEIFAHFGFKVADRSELVTLLFAPHPKDKRSSTYLKQLMVMQTEPLNTPTPLLMKDSLLTLEISTLDILKVLVAKTPLEIVI